MFRVPLVFRCKFRPALAFRLPKRRFLSSAGPSEGEQEEQKATRVLITGGHGQLGTGLAKVLR